MGSRRAACLIACLFAALAAPAAGAARFHPRVGRAFGLIPLHGAHELASGTNQLVVYHGGPVMHAVHVHTIFWAPSGFAFSGSPGAGVPSYKDLVKQYLSGVAADSGGSANEFSVLPEHPDTAAPGSYSVSYTPATDSIDDPNPYPAAGAQCASPAGVATCITDLQLEREVERMIAAHDPAGHGPHDAWFVFLPPNVDTCISAGECATNAFAGYHSLYDFGGGSTFYVAVPDPLVEGVTPPGADPQGNPEAESSLDTVAHELAEVITNPDGTGWMDPNGFEVGDKCEFGPQFGPPLGFAADGSPYNQVIAGQQYLTQMMWSNAASGCVQRSDAALARPGLASVELRQFSSLVRGDIGRPQRGVAVAAGLVRAGTPVAVARGRTDASGRWGPLELRSLATGRPEAASDDRDILVVSYGQGGPAPDLIATGDGANPFTESGYTGWYALDHGFAVRPRAVAIAPCSQVGVLGLSVDGRAARSPVDACETEGDLAVVSTRRLRRSDRVSLSSLDNRAVSERNRPGALVRLTVALGEPEAIGARGNSLIPFAPSGLPSCTALLSRQAVSCSGLVAGADYRLRGVRARADRDGVARFGLRVRGGTVLVLRGAGGRTLTALHVARLRVDLAGPRPAAIASGRCEPGAYFGAALRRVPVSGAVGLGVAGDGTICPLNGRAGGLPAGSISVEDSRSGGFTRADVPALGGVVPVNDATLYGPFVALAQVRQGRATVSVSIRRAGSSRVVFRARNVVRGRRVRGLRRGVYLATWVLRDANGDTRTVRTRFVEAL